MKLSDYQQAAHRTSLQARHGEGDMAYLIYPTLKLAGEAGEFAEEDRAALAGELGDVLWYVAEVATVLGLDLDRRDALAGVITLPLGLGSSPASPSRSCCPG